MHSLNVSGDSEGSFWSCELCRPHRLITPSNPSSMPDPSSALVPLVLCLESKESLRCKRLKCEIRACDVGGRGLDMVPHNSCSIFQVGCILFGLENPGSVSSICFTDLFSWL